MKLPKLLIAEGDDAYRADLEALFCQRCIVQACSDGGEALRLLSEFEPDMLVVDLMLPKMDGLSLIQELRKMDSQTMILAQTSFSSPYVTAWLQKLEVDYVMMKPCKLEAVDGRVQDFIDLIQGEPAAPERNRSLADALMRLGVEPKLSGYRYLMAAIPQYSENPTQSITKELYPAVGESKLVERSIRSAIDKAWQQRDETVWREYFSCSEGGFVPRPSNGTFIARVAQRLAQPSGKSRGA